MMMLTHSWMVRRLCPKYYSHTVTRCQPVVDSLFLLSRRLWNDVFCLAQDMLSIPRGTIRGTVLIETLLAAFEMEEILYELRDHSSGAYILINYWPVHCIGSGQA